MRTNYKSKIKLSQKYNLKLRRERNLNYLKSNRFLYTE